MIQKRFNSVSASEGGDYLQIIFEEKEGDPEGGYFLIQGQTDFPDGGEFYIESNDAQLCGRFAIEAATLSWQCLRFEMPSTEWEIIQVEFAADQAIYEELGRVLSTMFENKLRRARQNA